MSRYGTQSMSGRTTRRCLVALPLVINLLAADVSAQKRTHKSAAMAEKLAALRTEINDLDATLRTRRNLVATELRGLQTRANELKLAEDAERIKVQTLESEVAALEASIAGNDKRSAALRDAVRTAIPRLEAVVNSGLPFKQQQRLAALTQIGRDLENGKADVSAAAARVWRFIQDERRLASTVEQTNVSIVLSGDDTPTLVRVVRVGSVAMFVYAGANRWGHVVRDPAGAFVYADIHDREQRSEIKRLFESVEKQIREGRYRLPLLKTEVVP